MSELAGLPWDLELDGDEHLRLSYEPERGILAASLLNSGTRPWRPGRVVVEARLDLPAKGGWIWTPAEAMNRPPALHRFEEEPGTVFRGEQMAVISLPARLPPSLLVGALAVDRFGAEIRATVATDKDRLAGLSIVWDLEGCRLEPGQALALPPILLLEGEDAWALARVYAASLMTGRRERARRLRGSRAPAGWCSWYELGRDLTEADVLETVAEMRWRSFPGDVVQVDDGYQSCTGDWLHPGERFPAGMGSLAALIREAGFRPGLWLAPLVLHEESRTLREHPEYALRRRDGEVLLVDTWLGRCAVLDVTRPEAREWLAGVIRTAVDDWGFEYLKLDALQFAVQRGDEVRYAEAGMSGRRHLREALEVMRRAAGPRTVLVGCTSPFGPAVGTVDCMRVGPDVSPGWDGGDGPSLSRAAGSALMRGWMHGVWWVNDPDCLLLRQRDEGPTGAEARLLATAVALSGGSVFVGDDFRKLSAAELGVVGSLIPPTGVAARPQDLEGSPFPSIWRADLDEERALVGVLNWSDEPHWIPVTKVLDPGELAFDVWRGSVLGRGDLFLGPHDGSLWQVSRPGLTPRAVGDTGHVNYETLFERRVSGRLQLRNDGQRPRTVAVESRGRTFLVRLAPGQMRWFD